MKFRTFRYFVNESVRNLVRNRLMSIASILTVASCIFIVSIVFCLTANIDYFLSQLESSIIVTVYIDDEISTEAVGTLHDRILAVPSVSKIKYIPAKIILDDFINTLDDPGIAEGLEFDNPFRRQFDIEIDDIRNQEDVIKALEEMRPLGIAKISHSKDLADIARSVSDIVRSVCIALILILGVISIVIIVNTIRITVNARTIEIGIMKYVGATDWFIRWPFIIEGVMIGVVGGLIPAAACWFFYNRAVDALKEGLLVIDFVQFRADYDIFSYLFPFALLLGTLIGMTGSMFSVRRHLKV